MSEIVTHPTTVAGSKPGASSTAVMGMPMALTTEFRHKRISITIPGQWQGSADENGVHMVTEFTADQQNTIVKCHFTGKEGAFIQAMLTSTDPNLKPYELTLTCRE